MNARAKTHPPFTGAEFYKMAAKGAFDGFRVELRRGAIVKLSPNYLGHGRAQVDVLSALRAAVDATELDWQVLASTTVNFGDGFEPTPDVIVLDRALLPACCLFVPPTAVRLIVEIAEATLDDDMGEKREDYASAGVAEYWVADLNAQQVIRHAAPKGSAFGTELPTPLSGPLAMLTASTVVARIK